MNNINLYIFRLIIKILEPNDQNYGRYKNKCAILFFSSNILQFASHNRCLTI